MIKPNNNNRPKKPMGMPRPPMKKPPIRMPAPQRRPVQPPPPPPPPPQAAPQPQEGGCGCGGSQRANIVRRVINVKRKG